MNQKNNIFEELNKMRNLIHTKPGVVISEQATQQTEEQKIANEINISTYNATNEEQLINAVKSITSSQQFWKVNEILKTIGSKKDFVTIINDELGYRDSGEIEKIIAHLKTIGITASAEFIKEYRGKPLKVPGFKSDTFKITSQPTTTVPDTTGVSKDDSWKTTYKCVLAQPGVVAIKLKDGSTAYKVNNIKYFNNGRKRLADNKTIANYSCQTEFKQTPNKPLGNTKNYANIVADYSKKLQTSLGVQPTGQLSDNDLQNILASL